MNLKCVFNINSHYLISYYIALPAFKFFKTIHLACVIFWVSTPPWLNIRQWTKHIWYRNGSVGWQQRTDTVSVYTVAVRVTSSRSMESEVQNVPQKAEHYLRLVTSSRHFFYNTDNHSVLTRQTHSDDNLKSGTEVLSSCTASSPVIYLPF